MLHTRRAHAPHSVNDACPREDKKEDMNDEIRQLRRETDAAVQQSAAIREALQRSVDRLARQVDDCSASQQALKESVDQLRAKLEELV